MIGRLFPRTIDNSYDGPKAALWSLGILAAVKMAMAINSILNGRDVLISADGVPLGAFPHEAAQTVMALFAIWAWGLLILALLAVLTLVRYRAMTPLLFAVLLVEHAGRKLILQFVPIFRTGGAPAPWINAALLALTGVGLLLSLRKRTESTEPRAGSA